MMATDQPQMQSPLFEDFERLDGQIEALGGALHLLEDRTRIFRVANPVPVDDANIPRPSQLGEHVKDLSQLRMSIHQYIERVAQLHELATRILEEMDV